MNIVLAAVEPELADAWERFCGDLPGVAIHRGSILDVHCEAVVSPANSFGFMDGGIDHLYSRHFGWHVQRRLQEAIQTRHLGELLVGQAEIISTDDARIPFVIAAPTMRVPMILRETVNSYLPLARCSCSSSTDCFGMAPSRENASVPSSAPSHSPALARALARSVPISAPVRSAPPSKRWFSAKAAIHKRGPTHNRATNSFTEIDFATCSGSEQAERAASAIVAPRQRRHVPQQ